MPETTSMIVVFQKTADARPPDPPIEIPLRNNVTRMYISQKWMLRSTARRKGVRAVRKSRGGTVPSCIVATHSDACRERMERLVVQDPVGADRVVRHKTRHDEEFSKTYGRT